MVSCPGLPQRPIIGRPVRPLTLGLLAARQDVVPGGQPVRLYPKLARQHSSGSPRSSRSTASIFLPADRLVVLR
jgi:hypothetical protein